MVYARHMLSMSEHLATFVYIDQNLKGEFPDHASYTHKVCKTFHVVILWECEYHDQGENY
jgi:hypothetical protein